MSHTPSAIALAKLSCNYVCNMGGSEVRKNWDKATKNGEITESVYKCLIDEHVLMYGKAYESLMKDYLPLCTLRLCAVVDVETKHACYIFKSREVEPTNNYPRTILVQLLTVSSNTWRRCEELMDQKLRTEITTHDNRYI